MTPDHAIHLIRDALFTAFLLAAPPLVAGLIVGVLIGVFQAVTSIQDATLASAVKLASVGTLVALLLPWLQRTAVSYMYRALTEIARIGPGGS
jgi:flagellar biosynthetic protein FliQ